MSIANVAFTRVNVGISTLSHFNDTVIVQLRIPDAGKYVLFGRVVISNFDKDVQNATARLTTLNGATEIDRVDIGVSGISADEAANNASVSLQGTLILPNPHNNDIVDLRCATFKGQAREATLFAISVDELQ